MKWLAALVVALVGVVAVAVAWPSATNSWAVLLWSAVVLAFVAPSLLVLARFTAWQAAILGLAPGLLILGLGLASRDGSWGSRTAEGTEDWTNAGAVVAVGLLAVAAGALGAVLAVAVALVAKRTSSTTR